MREYFMAVATQQLSKIERFSHFSSDAQTPHRRRFVHQRNTRLDVSEIGSRCGIADRKEMRFRGALKKRDKYRSCD